MERSGIVTLTTDFGGDGPCARARARSPGGDEGTPSWGLAPGTQIVDVSHAIAPQNILEGAFVMAEIVPAFPPGTVHLGVVDPGVGTDRALIAASVAGHWFVLPDNGLITLATRNQAPSGIWEITNQRLRRTTVSTTFHGRDILAPAAAHLLRGGDPADLGPSRSAFVRIPNFGPTEEPEGCLGEVVYRDAFGNLITNLAVERLGAQGWTVEIAGERITRLSRTYGDHSTGSLIALIGSNGWLEVAVVNGDAGQQLSAGPGTPVRVRRATS